MALEGSIKDFGLADIFQLISVQKKSGALLIESKKKQATIYFENGLIVSATTTSKKDIEKIGRILIKSKKITKRQLKMALKAQKKTPHKVGYLLEKTGNITKSELREALQLQVNETVFNIFRWKEGRYVFEQKEVAYDKEYLKPINTEFILMEAIRQVDEWPFIEKKIPSYNIIFEKSPEGESRLATDIFKNEADLFFDIDEEKGKKEGQEKGKATLSEEERIVYELVDGVEDVSSIIDISKLGEFETCKVLSSLFTAGLIRVKFQPAEIVKKKRAKIYFSKVTSLTPFIVMVFKGMITIAIIGGFYMILNINGTLKQLRNSSNFLKIDIARAKMENLSYAAELYFIEKGHYPLSLNSLLEIDLINKNETRDPWGKEFIFHPIERSVFGKYKLFTFGPDGVEGTGDDITYPKES